MGVGHVGRVGGVLAAAPEAAMRGHPPAFEEEFDGGGAQPDLDALVHQLMGEGVVVVVDDDVVIDVDGGVAPFGDFIAARGQRAQRGTIELLEERPPGDAERPQRPAVEGDEELADRGVELGEAEEAAVAQYRQDPPLGHEHVGLDDRFVPRAAGAGRHDGRSVELRELEVGAIDDGLVAARLGDAAEQVIGHKDRRAALKIFEHPHVGADPGCQVLGRTRLSVDVTAGAERADKQLHRDDFPREGVDDRRPFPREVDEDLLAGAVDLAHRGSQRPSPALVVPAKLAVAIPGGLPLEILQPEAQQRHPGPLELVVDPGHVRQGSGNPDQVANALEEAAFELPVVPVLRQGPHQPGLVGPAAVLRHRPHADPTRPGDGAVGQALLVLQPQDFTYLSHQQPLRRHVGRALLCGGHRTGRRWLPTRDQARNR
jgi:hypothetical protein